MLRMSCSSLMKALWRKKTYDAVASVLEEGKQYVFPGFFGQGQ